MSRLIDWFARNHISANLMMGVMFIGGLAALASIPQKIFPDVDLDIISISAAYPGAGPSEVEHGVCTRIEENIESIPGIKTMHTTAAEGQCAIMLELVSGTRADKVLSDVKNAVDGIRTFPEQIERVTVAQASMKRPVLQIAVSGRAEERALKELGQKLRDQLVGQPGITQAELGASRAYEITIEVSESALRRYGLTFSQVSQAVRRSSLDLPGGSIKADGGEILLRTTGQAYRGAEFEDLVVMRRPDGTRVTLGEVATVIDGFAESDFSVRFNGEPAVMVSVSRVGNENTLTIASLTKAFLEQARARVPEGISLTIWQDNSAMLRDRLDTLLGNGRIGLLLVLVVLTLFLRPRLAFWVSVGVPISVLGSMVMLNYYGLSIDGISTFGFILVLGLLVDDAIVIAENVHTHQQRGEDPLESAISGTKEVSVPVIFGVLTTMMAFMPLWFTPGVMGAILKLVTFVVVVCLFFSLVESQLILPAHLGHTRKLSNTGEVTLMLIPLILLTCATLATGLDTFLVLTLLAGVLLLGLRLTGLLERIANGIISVQWRFGGLLERFIQQRYRHWLEVSLRWRYTTVAGAVALLLVCLGTVAGGHMKFTFFPAYEGDTISARLTMPQGMPAEATLAAVKQLENGIELLKAELDPIYAAPGESIVRHSFATLGLQPGNRSSMGGGSSRGSNLAQVQLELAPGERRDISTQEVEMRWRELVGHVPEATKLEYSSVYFGIGEPINVRLKGADVDELREAAARIGRRLREYPGVVDVSDSFEAGKQELKLSMLPSGESLGLSLQDLAGQVRQAFFGEEAQRIQRGPEDVRVMVRYPEDQRRSLGDLETMLIRTPEGAEVPFTTVARAEAGRGYATIQRTNGQRVINVTANVDLDITTANIVLADLRRAGFLKTVLAEYPGVSFSMEGQQREQSEALSSMGRLGIVALFGIYALLAIPLRSYSQPLIIMSIIPFGLIGAVLGHLLIGQDLMFPSIMGLVAASGVVVNSSLVIVHLVNRRRDEGMPIEQAALESALARFRPIILTTLTTFVGVMPLILSTSVQARQLAPMATSLAFGVLVSSSITLLVVPSLYLILEDLRGRSRRGKRSAPEATPSAPRQAAPLPRLPEASPPASA